MKIKMFLKSDIITGSGEGIASVIDSDIKYNNNGIPYIPAKRIKGILRESAMELYDYGSIKNSVNDIFGETGRKFTGGFYISNGYLSEFDDLNNFMENIKENNNLTKIFNREAILDNYTYLRTQTTINEKGVAKKNSLRTFRVLSKGLEFYFDLKINNDYVEDIKNILKVTRHTGISRTRGFGEVKFTLIKEADSMVKNASNQCGNDILYYEIKNKSQLMVKNIVGSDDFSDSYISGSIILGLFAREYMVNNNIKEKAWQNEDFFNLFLSGKVKFSNAYISSRENIFFPITSAIVRDKNSNKHYNLVDEGSLDELLDNRVQFTEYSDSYLSDNNQRISPEYEIEYHHCRPIDKGIGYVKDNKSSGTFFQFEVLKKSQYFAGYIEGPENLLNKLLKIVPNGKNIFIGKSKTAQYGDCNIKYRINYNPYNEIEWEKDERISVKLQSDLILRNKFGRIIPDIRIFLEEFAEQLQVKSDQFELVQSVLKTKTIGGFYGAWCLPKNQYQCIAAGSELVLKNKSGKDFSNLIEISKFGFGEFTEQGYGRIKFETDIKKNPPVTEYKSEPEKTDINFDKIIKPLKNMLLDNLILTVSDMAFEKVKKNYYKKTVTSTFISKLLFLIENSNNITEFENKCKSFKEHAQKQLKKIKELIFYGKQDDFYKRLYELESNPIKILSSERNIDKRVADITKSDIEYLYTRYIKNVLNFIKWQDREENKNE